MLIRKAEFIEETPHRKRSKSKLQIQSPEDDWTKITDLSSRRRVQNRLAQRNHRANARKRQREDEEPRQSSPSLSSSSASSIRQESIEPLSFQFESIANDDNSCINSASYKSLEVATAFPYQYHTLPTPANSPDYLYSKMDSVPLGLQHGALPHHSMSLDHMLDDMSTFEPYGSLSSSTRLGEWSTPYIPECGKDYFDAGLTSWNPVHSVPLEAGFEHSDQSQRTPTQRPTTLHLAASQGHACIIDMLIGIGLDIDSPDDEGKTALHVAALAGHCEAVGVLIAKGAALEAKDTMGRSALHWAVEQGHEKVVMLLLQRGADAS